MIVCTRLSDSRYAAGTMSSGRNKEARDLAARVFRISFHDRCTFATLAREGNWSRTASRGGFWDCYWGRAGQLVRELSQRRFWATGVNRK